MKERGTRNEERKSRGALLLPLFLVSCFLFFPFFAAAYTFSRDLKLGDTGEDVRALQIILNADVRTRVADSGSGSPGNETVFFGEKTHTSVITYQNIHAQEILVPLGLAVGTGYVGEATRKRLSSTEISPINGSPTSSASLGNAIAAFDTIIGGSAAETNRSPVDDPRIPKTQDELFAAVDDFAGSDASKEEIKDFSAQMVLARYGYNTDLERSTDNSNANNEEEEDAREDSDNNDFQAANDNSQSSDSGETGAGCFALLLDLLGL